MKLSAIAVAVLFLAGCGSSSHPNMTGNWTFVVTSTAFGGSGTGVVALTQSGSSISGTLNFSGGTPCAASPSLTGTVSGTNLSLQLNENGQTVSLTGTANSSFSAASGDYTAPAGGCTNGDFGTWTATKH